MNLIPGQHYRLIYQVPGIHRKPRQAVMRFLAYGQGHQGDLVFDLRPLAGTQYMRSAWIISADRTDAPLSLDNV